MKLVNWPPREGNATESEITTLQELWGIVHTVHAEELPPTGEFIREISANTELDEVTPYLVLSWVELEA